MHKNQLLPTEQQFFKEQKRSFFSAVKWNTFESIIYQLLFITHQAALYWYCDTTLYGKAGALFSSSYFLVTLLLCGFEGSLIPYFQSVTANQKAFKRFFTTYCVAQIIGVALVCTLGAILFITYSSAWPATTVLLVAIFIVIEATKKLIKHLLYLVYYNRFAALLEIGQMILYTSTIWIAYLLTHSFSLALIFIPFCCYSFIFCCGGLFFLQKFYRQLPKINDLQTAPPFATFAMTRLSVFINQLCRLLFSANFLVPLFAIHGGFKQAGIMTFVNYVSQTASFFMYKICIPPAEALFSRIKHTSANVHAKAFKLIMISLLIVTGCVALFVLLNGSGLKLLFEQATPTPVFGIALPFFFLVHAVENMFIVYEKFFLLEDKLSILTIGNLISCSLCCIPFWFSSSFFTLVLTILLVRLFYFGYLSYLVIKLTKRTY